MIPIVKVAFGTSYTDISLVCPGFIEDWLLNTQCQPDVGLETPIVQCRQWRFEAHSGLTEAFRVVRLADEGKKT
ncbi:hypothetical protein PHISCL_00645 [Aspergillus sclerotialis]|uniref:Uncharacterized protein n=1 Tax=Aspergillus sclerotialis TaxID=2070753 RepID=A0A3A2ZWI3_9EURO|nr:hypothetical protein PHISCL_00645 [Aspergillus sclerotialis]